MGRADPRRLGAAVAAGSEIGATATDNGGLHRQPAAFTGTVGSRRLRPLLALGHHCVGIIRSTRPGRIARTGARQRDLLRRWRVTDPKDTTSVDRPCRTYGGSGRQIGPGFKIGVPKEYRRRRA